MNIQNIPNDILHEIIKFLDFSEFYNISTFIPKSCVTHQLNKTKIILSSSQQIDKLLYILDNVVNENFAQTLNLEIKHILSLQDTIKLGHLEGTYIKIHCMKGSGSLIHISDIIDKFETREIHFYIPYMNLPVVFNILMSELKNTTIFFHKCKRLYMDHTTFFDRHTYYNNYFDNMYFTYLKESELNHYFRNHPFMHVFENNYKITENYIKIMYKTKLYTKLKTYI